jgi:hypothetical protein
MQIEISQHILIAALTILFLDAVVFVGLFFTLGRLWRRHEDARKTSGVAAVLILALIGVPFGVVDFGSWLFFCLLFAVAGGVATSLKITEQTKSRKAWEAERMGDGSNR